ncbi:chymotrypsin-1-like [Pieris napi]|uniref:chymotrypsin-1-like n=1 Tax=Pieris napi TaxID=78633 RepID=UPI001FB981E0|nr:chymotrypsin-1-like [Pieris napi]
MYSFLPLCVFALLCQVQGTWARDAKEGEFPYQAAVLLRLRNKELLYICSGAILNQRYILTLALCAVQYKPSTINILVGSNDLARRNNTYYTVDTVRQFSQPKYNVTIFSRNNIAVVRVKNQIIFNKRVQPIAISNQDVMNGQTYSLTAFRNHIDPNYSTRLQLFLVMAIQNNKQCNSLVGIGLDSVRELFCMTASPRDTGNENLPPFSYQGGPIASKNELRGLNIAARGRRVDKDIVAVGLRLAPYRNMINSAIKN